MLMTVHIFIAMCLQLAKQTPMGYATGQNTHLIASAPSQASLEQTYLTG